MYKQKHLTEVEYILLQRKAEENIFPNESFQNVTTIPKASEEVCVKAVLPDQLCP